MDLEERERLRTQIADFRLSVVAELCNAYITDEERHYLKKNPKDSMLFQDQQKQVYHPRQSAAGLQSTDCMGKKDFSLNKGKIEDVPDLLKITRLRQLSKS